MHKCMQGSCPQIAPRLVKEADNKQIIPSTGSIPRKVGYSWAFTGTFVPLLLKPAGWTLPSPPSTLPPALPTYPGAHLMCTHLPPTP